MRLFIVITRYAEDWKNRFSNFLFRFIISPIMQYFKTNIYKICIVASIENNLSYVG